VPTTRTPISACIIAANEAERIGACLESVAFCDEIVVLDSGSTDGTQAICRAAGARVVETDWPGCVTQKARAVAEARHDWILAIDADERLDEPLRASIEALCARGLEGEGRPAAYAVSRKLRYLGRWMRHGGLYPEWRVRLFDRRRARWGGKDPHDRVEVDGPSERILAGDLEHHSYRDVTHHVAKMNAWTTAAAGSLRSTRRSALFGVLVRPPAAFLKMWLIRAGFLDGGPGFVAAGLSAWYVFLKYVKLARTRHEGTRSCTTSHR